ncbi:uncharacterized protein LOC62_06G008581 [Vanrija pseudolonga]|uniref:Uncharacterized protein n=1 Tax=Vanrija pseudolonga TaxID=143232 RepID=A0AAF0YIH0_9TREE|nr:hypothetical protein LOC62_06G008581 [Vanrija pseudolonga]
MSANPLRWLRRDEPSVDWALVHQLVNTGVEPDMAISIIERAQNDVGLLAELIAHERHSVAPAPAEEASKPKDTGLRAKAAAVLRPRAWSGASATSRPSLESESTTAPSPVPVIRVDDCRICTEEELSERAEGLRAQ